MSGGTDIVSCFVNGNPLSPVRAVKTWARAWAWRLKCGMTRANRSLAKKANWSAPGTSRRCPIGLWNDPDGEKLRQSYFSLFPGVWAQGDYAEQRPHGGMLIHGRSDAVLNPGGVRIGTAEIYRQVEKVPEGARQRRHRPAMAGGRAGGAVCALARWDVNWTRRWNSRSAR
jgi:acetoacetyl-CoA synthetase